MQFLLKIAEKEGKPSSLLEGEPLEGPVHGLEQPWPPAGSSPYHFRWSGKRVPMVLVSPHLDAGLCSRKSTSNLPLRPVIPTPIERASQLKWLCRCL